MAHLPSLVSAIPLGNGGNYPKRGRGMKVNGGLAERLLLSDTQLFNQIRQGVRSFNGHEHAVAREWKGPS